MEIGGRATLAMVRLQLRLWFVGCSGDSPYVDQKGEAGQRTDRARGAVGRNHRVSPSVGTVGRAASPLLSVEATDRGPALSRPDYSTAGIGTAGDED
ncbi:hypothetical protein [Salinarchaeum laminariae]|uniref:hypothetical protein n=1 Tax=Salinarchaeum laminariae TaxID=869888 RepID=UPI0020C0F22E|nr:hypothetical protein [Salinarchaeum laminariae]